MQVRIFTYTVFVHVAMSDEEGLEEGEVEERLEAERGGEGEEMHEEEEGDKISREKLEALG